MTMRRRPLRRSSSTTSSLRAAAPRPLAAEGSRPFLLGVLACTVVLSSVFFLLYSNKTATNGYALLKLQEDHGKLISELEKWSNMEVRADVITTMDTTSATTGMSRAQVVQFIEDRAVASATGQ